MNLESNGGNDGELSYPQLDNEHMRVRMQKLEALRAKGVDPFGARFERTHLSKDIIDDFQDLDGSVVRIAGRLMAMRSHGKATFADVLDLSGRIQVYTRVDALGEDDYELFTSLDIGDIIGVVGKVFRTRRGEVSVEIEGFVLLCKALRPLPEKWHGLVDIDLRYRQRYLDLIVNPDVRRVFLQRTAVSHELSNFL